jgi:hypothetical protein
MTEPPPAPCTHTRDSHSHEWLMESQEWLSIVSEAKYVYIYIAICYTSPRVMDHGPSPRPTNKPSNRANQINRQNPAPTRRSRVRPAHASVESRMPVHQSEPTHAPLTKPIGSVHSDWVGEAPIEPTDPASACSHMTQSVFSLSLSHSTISSTILL